MAMLPTVNNMINSNTTYGSFCRLWSSSSGGAKTGANATSGLVSGSRFPDPLVMPSSLGAGVTGIIPAQIDMLTSLAGTTVAGLEVLMGSINMNTGTYTDNSAMPSRRLVGDPTSYQTASLMTVLVVSSAVTATTPTITITYTNQAGTTNQTATMVLPSNGAVNTAYMVTPHLQTAAGVQDTGVRDITNITKSAGTAGTIQVYGFIPMAVNSGATNVYSVSKEPLTTPLPLISLQASDTLGVYVFGAAAIAANVATTMLFNGIAET